MNNKKYDAKIEFGKQAKIYREHFELTQEDVSILLGILQPDYSEIEAAKKSIGLDRAELVACVYGIRYYQMANPVYPFPVFNRLPKKTQKAILNRKQIGAQIRDYYNDVAGNLDKILDTNFLNTPKTAEQIWDQLPEMVKEKIEPRRITDLLGKEPRKSKIEKLPPLPGAGKKNRYQLKKNERT